MVAVLFRHILLAGWLVPRILCTVMDFAGFAAKSRDVRTAESADEYIGFLNLYSQAASSSFRCAASIRATIHRLCPSTPHAIARERCSNPRARKTPPRR